MIVDSEDITIGIQMPKVMSEIGELKTYPQNRKLSYNHDDDSVRQYYYSIIYFLI